MTVETCELSLSEAGALAFKAARGVGLDWGMAEEARASVVWVHHRGLPGLQALLGVLDLVRQPMERPAGSPSALAAVSVLHAGAALSDHGSIPPEGLHLTAVAGPVLMVPFVAHLPGVHLVQWRGPEAGAQVTVRGTGAAGAEDIWCVGATQTESVARISITPLPEAPAAKPVARSTRARVRLDHLVRLEAFAAATYAPATEASRTKGAGEG